MAVIRFKLRSGAIEKEMQRQMMSISELSRMSGLSRPAIYSLIKEDVDFVRVATCRKVSLALGVDVTDLFEVVGE